MARRPLLPENATAALSFMGSLVIWALATNVAATVIPGSAATILGVVLGACGLVGIPIVLGQPTMAVIMPTAVGGLVLLGGFVLNIDTLGLGRTLLIFLPATALLVLSIWLLKRYVVPALSGGG